MEGQGNIIDSKENVARLLSNEWLVEGEVSVDAFALAPKETYLSVNRPSVPTYEADVRKFVSSHREYLFAENNEMVFSAAMMNVGDIRGIIVDVDGSSMDLDVEIEARDAHTKSHAGIFVRSHGENIVRGRSIMSASVPKGVSSDDILMEVQWCLKDIAKQATFELSLSQEQE